MSRTIAVRNSKGWKDKGFSMNKGERLLQALKS